MNETYLTAAGVVVACLGLIQTLILAAIGAMMKVIFGLVDKNEKKSDEADMRIHGEIKEVRKELKEVEERYRMNDHKLFDATGELKSCVREIRVLLETMKDDK